MVKQNTSVPEVQERSLPTNIKAAFRGLYLPEEESKHLSSEAGCPIKDEYGYVTKKGGHVVLEKVGTSNLYDLIQANKDDVDINILMARFMNGEDDILDRVYGQYADVVDMPRSYAEMQQRIIDANAAFESLPPEFREKFNNNPAEYYDQFGSAEFLSKVGDYLGVNDVIDDLADIVPAPIDEVIRKEEVILND